MIVVSDARLLITSDTVVVDASLSLLVDVAAAAVAVSKGKYAPELVGNGNGNAPAGTPEWSKVHVEVYQGGEAALLYVHRCK